MRDIQMYEIDGSWHVFIDGEWYYHGSFEQCCDIVNTFSVCDEYEY